MLRAGGADQAATLRWPGAKAQASEALTHLAFYAGWPYGFSAAPVVKSVSDTRTRWGKCTLCKHRMLGRRFRHLTAQQFVGWAMCRLSVTFITQPRARPLKRMRDCHPSAGIRESVDYWSIRIKLTPATRKMPADSDGERPLAESGRSELLSNRERCEFRGAHEVDSLQRLHDGRRGWRSSSFRNSHRPASLHPRRASGQ
jgi:hypothetical protein